MELKDIIHLSLAYGKKKRLNGYTPEEIISIGYDAYLLTDKLFKSGIGTKKSTYFMNILEWSFREEFRKTSHVKIPKNAWNRGVRTNTFELNKQEYEVSKVIQHNFFFDDHDLLFSVLHKLSTKHKLIITHKYELYNKEKLTFRALAKKMELSPQRVRMLHIEALKHLKILLKGAMSAT